MASSENNVEFLKEEYEAWETRTKKVKNARTLVISGACPIRVGRCALRLVGSQMPFKKAHILKVRED